MNGKWEGMTINGRHRDRQTACKLLHQAAHQAHDGDTIAEYDGLPVIARRAATTGRITLAVKAVHEHESGTEMPGPYLTGLPASSASSTGSSRTWPPTPASSRNGWRTPKGNSPPRRRRWPNHSPTRTSTGKNRQNSNG